MNSFLKEIKNRANIIKDAYLQAPRNIRELVKERRNARRSKRRFKRSLNDLIIAKTQAEHFKKYGRKMSPSYLKLEIKGGLLSKESKDYIKNKRKNTKKYRKLYK